MKKIVFLLFIFISLQLFSQSNSLFTRLSAIVDNNGKTWYNIDGYTITSEVFNSQFNEKELKKILRKHSISDTDTKIENKNINYKNYNFTKQSIVVDSTTKVGSFYFIENKNKTTTAISFEKNGNTDKEMEEELVNHIINETIPEENFVSMNVENLKIGTETISLSNDCYWTFLNTVQCPYNGEMNWSLHKTLEDAQQDIDIQFSIAKSLKSNNVVTEEIVNIDFQGVPTQAKKVLLSLKGLAKVAAKLSGGKYLTVYYVAAKSGDNYISCVLSYWNNDNITYSGLSPLLDKVMELK